MSFVTIRRYPAAADSERQARRTRLQIEQRKYPTEAIIKSWMDASLRVNEDYQRGSEWTLKQKQALIDSVYRAYPLPPLFLHEIRAEGLGGTSIRFDIVDGQQRIRALADFYKSSFPLLKSDDRSLHLPDSLRKEPAPWGGYNFSNLPSDLQRKFLSAELNCYVIHGADNADEIRDLFIRLQSGTALSRQQVRDAWPGKVGPFIETLAGKLQKRPALGFFRFADQRGQGTDEDGIDDYEQDRQFCAQLLCLFLARERDRKAQQGVTAADLDQLYHDNTDFDSRGPSAEKFLKVVGVATVIAETASGLSAPNGSKKKKHRKAVLFACFQLIQDLIDSKNFRFDQSAYKTLAAHILNAPPPSGKTVSGPAIASYFELWKATLAEIGPRLDARRAFTREETEHMLIKQGQKCAICGRAADLEDCEGDHFPTPFALGGPTSAENCRAVHKKCHPRGIAALADRKTID